MADALEKGSDAVITCGAPQSNHCRLTLAAARKEGMECHFLIEERVPGTYSDRASGNMFLFQLMGVDSIRVVPAGADMTAEMEKTAAELRASGRKPYIIPGGGSNAVGALGYVACAEEILSQSFRKGVSFDRVFTTSGSSGTHAGLAVGLGQTVREFPSRESTSAVRTRCRFLSWRRSPARRPPFSGSKNLSPAASSSASTATWAKGIPCLPPP